MSDARSFLDGRVVLHHGDNLDVMKTFADNSIDSIVTDPPYGLQFMGREWDKLWRNETEADRDYVEKTSGTLTSRARKLPDYSSSNQKQMQEWHEAWAREAIRVLKPGAHGLAMGGTRTFHRLVCAIEDAGAEIRDCLYYCYGSGFPKSHNISLDYEKELCYQTVTNGRTEWRYYSDNALLSTNYRHPKAIEWDGYGTSLKPAVEPICMFRKPLSEASIAANVQKWGVGAINVAGCKVPGPINSGWSQSGNKASNNTAMSGRNYARDPKPDDPIGRWPANLITDGSGEVLACFPESKSCGYYNNETGRSLSGSDGERTVYGNGLGHSGPVYSGDSGSAARFFASFPQEDGREFVRNATEANEGYHRPGHSMFTDKEFERGSYGGNPSSYFASFPQDANRLIYTSKADADDRLGSKHPTVKPIGLKQYLVRLVTPPGGTCLDHFAGTGTTGEACFREGFRCILIEREAEYIADIERRMCLVMEGPATRAHAGMKARGRPRDDGPLFGHSPSYESTRTIGPIGMNKSEEAKRRKQGEPAEPRINLTDLKIKLADVALAAGRDIEVRVTNPDDEASE